MVNADYHAQGHEAHGRCATCKNPIHRYPFGWTHVGAGVNPCPNLSIVVTCCREHVTFSVEWPDEPEIRPRVG